MPRQEFIDLIKELKKTKGEKQMSKRKFLSLFGGYRKRTSGNVWRINEFLNKEKMMVTPSYQGGWIDEYITIKPKDKVKIKNGNNSNEEFDPINRLYLPQKLVPVVKCDKLSKLQLNYEKATSKIHQRIQA